MSRDARLSRRPLSVAIIWPARSIAHQCPGHPRLSGGVCTAGPASDPGAGALNRDLVTSPWGRLGQEPVGALSAFPSGRLVLSVSSLPDVSKPWPQCAGRYCLRLLRGSGRSPWWPLPQTAHLEQPWTSRSLLAERSMSVLPPLDNVRRLLVGAEATNP